MGGVDRKLRPITRGLLERVRKAKAEGGAEPEFRLFARESKLGMTERIFYDTFPEGAARFLDRVLPNESMGRIIEIWDFRKEHGFPPGYISAGYNLPIRD